MTNLINFIKYKSDILKTYPDLLDIDNTKKEYYLYKNDSSYKSKVRRKKQVIIKDKQERTQYFRFAGVLEDSFSVYCYVLYVKNNFNINIDYTHLLPKINLDKYPFYTMSCLKPLVKHKDLLDRIKKQEVAIMDLETEMVKMYRVINKLEQKLSKNIIK